MILTFPVYPPILWKIPVLTYYQSLLDGKRTRYTFQATEKIHMCANMANIMNVLITIERTKIFGQKISNN